MTFNNTTFRMAYAAARESVAPSAPASAPEFDIDALFNPGAVPDAREAHSAPADPPQLDWLERGALDAMTTRTQREAREVIERLRTQHARAMADAERALAQANRCAASTRGAALDTPAGYVYVVTEAGETEPVKIGKANVVDVRAIQLEDTGTWRDLVVVHSEWFPYPLGAESALHNMFAESRIQRSSVTANGGRRVSEWFRIDATQAVSALRSIAEYAGNINHPHYPRN